MRKYTLLLAAATTVATSLGLTGLTSLASAAPNSIEMSTASADNRSAVRALTGAQQQELQRQIDETLASTRGGVQISANEISWNRGQPILTLPLPGQRIAPAASPAALRLESLDPTDVTPASTNWHGCPAGNDDNRWYCFYQYSDFGGRRLQWNWAKCATPTYFSTYGFANKASSWVNTTPTKSYWGMDVTVWQSAGNPDYVLWHEPPWHQVSYVGKSDDNKADYFEACRRS
jgi:hypothetical protein